MDLDPRDMGEILLWLLTAVVLLLIVSTFAVQQEEWQEEKQQAVGGQSGESGEPQFSEQNHADPFGDFQEREAEARASDERQRQLREKAERIRELFKGDRELAADLAGKALNRRVDPSELDNEEVLRQLAEHLEDYVLDILDPAITIPELNLDLDLSGQSKLERSRHRGDFYATRGIRGPHEIRNLHPSEWATPRRHRAIRIATGAARVVQWYQFIVQRKVFYLLEDVSPSMEQERLQNGYMRFIASRKIIRILAQQAMEGKVRFIYRAFHGTVERPMEVTDEASAKRFLTYLTTRYPNGSGTEILHALRHAVKSIREAKSIDTADILIISDGEDNAIQSVKEVKDLLGDNIRLHLISIGGAHNEALAKAATSVEVVR